MRSFLAAVLPIAFLLLAPVAADAGCRGRACHARHAARRSVAYVAPARHYMPYTPAHQTNYPYTPYRPPAPSYYFVQPTAPAP